MIINIDAENWFAHQEQDNPRSPHYSGKDDQDYIDQAIQEYNDRVEAKTEPVYTDDEDAFYDLCEFDSVSEFCHHYVSTRGRHADLIDNVAAESVDHHIKYWPYNFPVPEWYRAAAIRFVAHEISINDGVV
jgi:hypothetical protein